MSAREAPPAAELHRPAETVGEDLAQGLWIGAGRPATGSTTTMVVSADAQWTPSLSKSRSAMVNDEFPTRPTHDVTVTGCVE